MSKPITGRIKDVYNETAERYGDPVPRVTETILTVVVQGTADGVLNVTKPIIISQEDSDA